jgi:hypothetical protein
MCLRINYRSIFSPDVHQAMPRFSPLWHNITALDHHCTIYLIRLGRPTWSTEWDLILVVLSRWKQHLLPNHHPWGLLIINYCRKGRPSFNLAANKIHSNPHVTIQTFDRHLLLLSASFSISPSNYEAISLLF